MVRQNNLIVKLDLQDAYFSVPLQADTRKSGFSGRATYTNLNAFDLAEAKSQEFSRSC